MTDDFGSLRRRTFLRATGAAGGSLALSSAGDLAAADGCGDTSAASTETGSLDGANDGDDYTFTTALEEPCEVVYTLTSPDPVDFDLYLTLDGRTPGPGEYDRRSASAGTDETIVLDGEEVSDGAEYGVLVHAYDGSGEYTLDAEEFGRWTGDNQPPQAKFSVDPSTPAAGETVEFDADASYDDDGQIDQFYWEFGDGTEDYGEVVTHSYDDGGSYTVELVVTDDDGATDSETDTVEVTDDRDPDNAAPHAEFWAEDIAPHPGQTVEFDAVDSTDPDGSIVRYDWTFGDGDAAAGEVVSHSYANEGTYSVELTVEDDDGATDSASLTVDVENVGPTARIDVDTTAPAPGQRVGFDGRDSTDPDGSVVAYDWAFGDGAEDTGRRTDHAYDEPGYYDATLTVRDDDGVTDTTSVEIGVVNENLDASFSVSADSVGIGETVSVDASASSDPDDAIRGYEWDFGDGTTAAGVTASHSYDTGGRYTVTLTVTGEHGFSRRATRTVEVTNQPPTARIDVSSASPDTGQPVTFDASASTDPDGAADLDRFEWTFPGGFLGPRTKTGEVVTHEFDAAESVEVTLTVTDRTGAKDTATVTVDVQNGDGGGGGFW
jgi:PKD repeat protein